MLPLRMYFLVAYNLSDIQKGIQAGHAAMDYALRFGKTKLFREFVENHKTWIILNGGNTRSNKHKGINAGDMNTSESVLVTNKIPYGFFREPDLNDALTALCFICDERVFNFEKYLPYNWEDYAYAHAPYTTWVSNMGGIDNVVLRGLIEDKELA